MLSVGKHFMFMLIGHLQLNVVQGYVMECILVRNIKVGFNQKNGEIKEH